MAERLSPQQAATVPEAPNTRRDVAAGEVRAATGLLTGCIVVAIALRFFRLGDWGFDSDEVFMLRDSLNPQLTNPRPLMYLLNHYVILPFVPLDEFGLRLLPAFFGVLGVPAFYVVSRRLVGTRAALFGTFLVATSGLLVYYSQFARYWTLVFLFSAVYPFAIYLGLRDCKWRTLALGLLMAVLAALAHPVSVLLLAALGVWVLAENARRDRLAHLWSHKRARWGAGLVVILAALIAARLISILQRWVYVHDVQKQAGGGSEFLYRVPGGRGLGQLSLLAAYVESLTLPLVLAGMLGIYLLGRGRDRSLALLLACLFVVPIASIMVISIRTAISTFYLVPAIPALFIGAGVFLDRLAATDIDLHPRWLLPAAVTVMIIATGAPTLVSQYRDGRRYDFRGVARWLEDRLAPGDIVISDQPWVMEHYLPRAQVRRLVPDPVRLTRVLDTLQHSGAAKILWVVTPAPSHAFRTNPKMGDLNGWLYTTCQLRNTIGVGRVDFRQNFLQVFRCPPQAHAAALGAGQGDGTTSSGTPLRANTSR